MKNVNKKWMLFIIATFVTFFGIGYTLIKGTAANMETPANESFDDINFYRCVVDAYNEQNGLSVDYTTNLSDEELATIKSLSCNSDGKTEDEVVVSTLGLEKLTSLEILELVEANISTIDVSKNIMLLELAIGNSSITQLDLSSNTLLQKIKLTMMDVSSLDITNNINLLNLDIYELPLTDLDVSNNTKITNLSLSFTDIASLDVSNNVNLKKLSLAANKLTELDVSSNVNLTQLEVRANELTEINVSSNTALTTLNVRDNNITSLDVSSNVNLVNLFACNNDITTLDVSSNTKLSKLYVVSNKLTEFNVDNNVLLTELAVSHNNISSLDISKNTALIILEARNNKLTSLNVSANSALKQLDVGVNGLTSLDISNNSNLLNLSVYDNKLTSLDISQNELLERVNVAGNLLTTFDSSKNINLTELIVGGMDTNYSNGSGLGGAAVSNSTKGNLLTMIDASNNVKLATLGIDYNSYSEEVYVYKNGSVTLGGNVLIPSHLEWDSPTWVSDDEEIATVEGGLVTAHEIGVVNVVGMVSDKYSTTSVVNVFEITSEKYVINNEEGTIYIGNDSTMEELEENISYPKDKGITIEPGDGTIVIKNGDVTLKELKIIGYYSTDYDLEKDYIYVGTGEIDTGKITTKDVTLVVENNKLLVKYNDEIMDEYELISFATELKMIDDYIYASNLNGDSIVSKINLSYGELAINDNVLQIKYNSEILDEYKLVRLGFSGLTLIDGNKLYVANKTEEEIYKGIQVVNADAVIDKDSMEVFIEDMVIDELSILTVSFGNLTVSNNEIEVTKGYTLDEFKKQFSYDEELTYKLYNSEEEAGSMVLEIYYGEMLVDEYRIVSHDVSFADDIIVDSENMYIKYLTIGTTVSDFLSNVSIGNGRAVILDSDGDEKSNDSVLATGDVLTIYLGDVKTDEYTLSVIGDVNGDGELGLIDLVQMRKHIVKYVDPDTNEIQEKTGVYYHALDLNQDGEISLLDLVRIRKIIVGLI